MPASTGEHVRVWLAPRNADQLDALARAVADPNSGEYGQFLSESDYRTQFAPTADQVAAVRQWLTEAGLRVDSVGPDGHYVAVSGTADAVNAAFGTQLAYFRIKGQPEQAPSSDVSVPDSLAGVVEAVTGLTRFGHKVEPADLGPPAGFVNAMPCGQYYGEQRATNLPPFMGHTLPYSPCGYTPSQLRGAYGLSGNSGGFGLFGSDHRGGGSGFGRHNDHSASLGRGSTVAITDAFDASTLRQDANTYASLHGDPPFHASQFRDVSVPENADLAADCGGNVWYGEQTLDIEAVHGMAPGANVLYYGAASCYDDDLLAQLAQVVTDNQASIVTNSWGEPTFVVDTTTTPPCTPCTTIDEPLIDAYESIFKQGAVQGIGFYFSSGDAGDEQLNTGITFPDFPTEDPWVTSVGGTSLAISRHDGRLFETGWGTSKYSLSSDSTSWEPSFPWSPPFLYGAGGGFTVYNGQAAFFDRPWYQNGVVPSGSVGRGVPDIAMDADPTTGMLIGETQSFADSSRFGPPGVHYGEYRVGGTSLASPLLAGVQAVVQQSAHGRAKRIGFANPLIYFLSHFPGLYYDVTPQGDAGNIRSDYVNGLNASDGYVYSVRTFDEDSSLTTNRGWDDVTGVGSVTSRYVRLFDVFRR